MKAKQSSSKSQIFQKLSSENIFFNYLTISNSKYDRHLACHGNQF